MNKEYQSNAVKTAESLANFFYMLWKETEAKKEIELSDKLVAEKKTKPVEKNP